MNILYLTQNRIADVAESGIYTDLLRELVARGHGVYVAMSNERRWGLPTQVTQSGGATLLGVRTLNTQKVNIVEKGIGFLMLQWQYRRAIKRHLRGVRFDLIIYSTPPITFAACVRLLRRRHKAATYLMLKDIFPQNAVDIGLFPRWSPFYWYFRRQERRLYAASDHIGCMSPANVDFVVRHNPEVDPRRVELCPNGAEVRPFAPMPAEERARVRAEHGLPAGARVFVYGGNLGRPQAIPFLLQALEANAGREGVHFVVAGNGTEYGRVERWFRDHRPANATLLPFLPRARYDALVRACDVGMVFLDRRFTIPNYPSRLLSYVANSMPVLVASDINTDLGPIAAANGYGLWSESGDLPAFNRNLEALAAMPAEQLAAMGARGRAFMEANYDVRLCADAILKHVEGRG